jgi:hypothetical protein
MQKWPDRLQVNSEFGGNFPKLLTDAMRIWASYPFLGEKEGAAVYGDKGQIVIGNRPWKALDAGGQVLGDFSGNNDEAAHVQKFIDCIKSRNRPNTDLETVGHPSSLLCHMGNVASRIGRKLQFDPGNETFVDDADMRTG